MEWCAQAQAGNGAILVIPLQATGLPTDTVLRGCQFLSDVFAAGALEATFTNYGTRRALAGSDITIAVNTGTFVTTVTLASQIWPAAGGAVNNPISRVAIAYRPTSGSPDFQCRMITTEDWTGTTNGSQLTIGIGALTATVPA